MTVRSLQHISLTVPDLKVAEKFYSDFGLEPRKNGGNTLVMRCAGRDQDQVVLVEGKKKAQHHICFGTDAEGLAGAKRRLEAAGVRLLDAPNDTPGDGLWFRDPDGLLVNLRVAERAKWRSAPEFKINSPGHLNRIGKPGHPQRGMKVQPTRLGHTLRFTPQIETMIDFYTRTVGLILSDRSQDIVAFLRHHGGSDHHIFGFIKSDKPGFHHASFEVESLDHIGMGAANLLDKGYRDGWGFGRHVIGSNFFHYVRDPWNSLVEYFCDIDFIPDGAKWDAKDWPAEDSLYVWGPKTPEDFGANFEAAD